MVFVVLQSVVRLAIQTNEPKFAAHTIAYYFQTSVSVDQSQTALLYL